eukprot:GHVN01070078.1.p1 GENE.GHVN01070078.1~~GHVN01070078.1.p1  ORF type:complete len:274 (+),score=6.25 GHVN01070078.1:3-824(+)
MLDKLRIKRSRIRPQYTDQCQKLDELLGSWDGKPLSILLLGNSRVVYSAIESVLEKHEYTVIHPLIKPIPRGKHQIVVCLHAETLIRDQRLLYRFFADKSVFIGITEKMDFVDCLEKRVRSRFSQIALGFNNCTWEEFKESFEREFGDSSLVEEKAKSIFARGVEATLSFIGEALLTKKEAKRNLLVHLLPFQKKAILFMAENTETVFFSEEAIHAGLRKKGEIHKKQSKACTAHGLNALHEMNILFIRKKMYALNIPADEVSFFLQTKSLAP